MGLSACANPDLFAAGGESDLARGEAENGAEHRTVRRPRVCCLAQELDCPRACDGVHFPMLRHAFH